MIWWQINNIYKSTEAGKGEGELVPTTLDLWFLLRSFWNPWPLVPFKILLKIMFDLLVERLVSKDLPSFFFNYFISNWAQLKGWTENLMVSVHRCHDTCCFGNYLIYILQREWMNFTMWSPCIDCYDFAPNFLGANSSDNNLPSCPAVVYMPLKLIYDHTGYGPRFQCISIYRRMTGWCGLPG